MEHSTIIIPIDIEQKGPNVLGIKWSDGHESTYETFDLRLHCRCANCVDEWNGVVKVNRGNVPRDVHPLTIEGVGQYGLKIAWSDGHNTGIYAFRYLREICGCSQCLEPKQNKNK